MFGIHTDTGISPSDFLCSLLRQSVAFSHFLLKVLAPGKNGMCAGCTQKLKANNMQLPNSLDILANNLRPPTLHPPPIQTYFIRRAHQPPFPAHLTSIPPSSPLQVIGSESQALFTLLLQCTHGRFSHRKKNEISTLHTYSIWGVVMR